MEAEAFLEVGGLTVCHEQTIKSRDNNVFNKNFVLPLKGKLFLFLTKLVNKTIKSSKLVS